MDKSTNLQLWLPEDSDPLEVSKLSENFETLDGAIKETQAASGYQIGDTLTTWRTDLGENWLLCNGEWLRKEDYPELFGVCPGATSALADGNYANAPSISDTQSGINLAISYNGTIVHLYKVDTTYEIKIRVVDAFTQEEIYIDTGINGQYYYPGNGTATVINGVWYLFWQLYHSSTSTRRHMCMARCTGDPFNAENWEFYEQLSADYPIGDTVSAALINEGAFTLINGAKYAKYSITDGALVRIGAGDVPYVSEQFNVRPTVSKSTSRTLKNKLYTTYQSANNFYLYKLKEDLTGWDEIVSRTTHSNLAKYSKIDAIQDVLEVMFAYEGDGNSPPIQDAFYIEVAEDGSVTENVLATSNNPIPLSTEQRLLIVYMGRYLPIKHNGKYIVGYDGEYIAILNEITRESIDSFSAKGSLSIKFAIDTNAITKTSGDNTLVLPWRLAGANGLGIIPNFALPKISQSTTYTYIKAKEDAPNADQQTDTPAT